MGFNFFLGGEGFDRESWYQSAATYLRVNSNSFLPATWRFGLGCEEPRELSSANLGGEEKWLLPKGGIRGVGFRPWENGIEFVIATQASKKDFEVVDRLVALGIECGAVARDEEDQEITAKENRPSQQFEKWWKFGRASIASVIEKDDSDHVTLPIQHFAVTISRDDLKLSDEDLMDLLANKVERYGSAFIPSILGVEKDGKTARVVVYSDRGTLIPAEVDGIAIVEADQHGIPNIVPLDSFLQAMGDLAEKAGKIWYVGEQGFLSDHSKYESFRGLPELNAAGIPEWPPVANSSDEAISDAMELLMKMPIYIFFFVAGADGNVDEQETRMFFAMLQNADEAPSRVFAESVAHLLAKLPEVFPKVVSEELPRLPLQLALAKGVIESTMTDPEENALYKLSLLTLAREIAAASGGRFLGFGSKISRSERKSIEALKELLGVSDFKI